MCALSHSNSMHNITYHEHIAKKYNSTKATQAPVNNSLKKIPSQTLITEESNVENEARPQNTQVIVVCSNFHIYCEIVDYVCIH